jgi:hypothetical protein
MPYVNNHQLRNHIIAPLRYDTIYQVCKYYLQVFVVVKMYLPDVNQTQIQRLVILYQISPHVDPIATE